MENGYELFVEDLRQALLAATGFREDNVFFRKAGEKPATTGDRMFLKCGGEGDGYSVCGLYTRELYESYRNGVRLETMVRHAIMELEKIEAMGITDKMQKLEDYDKIRTSLFIRLLNLERNREALKGCVYQILGDIALVLYLKVGEKDGCLTSVKIRADYVKTWGIGQDQAMEDALLNTYFMTPPRIYFWEKMIYDPDYTGENFMDLMTDFPVRKNAMGNCLSTTMRTNGAVAVFLPGVAQRLSQLMGNGFYMVFTSVHEVMIHSDQSVYPEDLRSVLKETVENTTPEEDFLSLNIYHYDCENETYSCV